MLKQKVWIPILSILVIAMGCGLFYGRQVAKQVPVTIIKPVEVEHPATPKPPPPGQTESGHWHGDEWHAEPHKAAESEKETRNSFREALHYALFPKTTIPPTDEMFKEVYGNIADLPEETDYDIAVKGYVAKHFEKYPDCDDYNAILSDAKLSARWYLADMEQR